MQRREELTEAEREVARLVNERADAIVAAGRARAAQIMEAARAEGAAYANRGTQKILDLMRKRGVEIGTADGVAPELDPKTRSAVAVTITKSPPLEPMAETSRCGESPIE